MELEDLDIEWLFLKISLKHFPGFRSYYHTALIKILNDIAELLNNE